jgi:hypothetical protein
MTRTWLAAVLVLGVTAGSATGDPAEKKAIKLEIRPIPSPGIWCGTWLDLRSPVSGPRIERMADPPPEIADIVIAIDDAMAGTLKLKTELKPEPTPKPTVTRRARRGCLWCR